MNKFSILKKIASVATELDTQGFIKEAKSLDLILIKLAQSNTNEDYEDEYEDELYNPWSLTLSVIHPDKFRVFDARTGHVFLDDLTLMQAKRIIFT